MIEFSFTHYHWLLVKRIIEDTTLKVIRQISIEDFQILLSMVFPDGETFLHKISNMNEILEVVVQRMPKNFNFLFIRN